MNFHLFNACLRARLHFNNSIDMIDMYIHFLWRNAYEAYRGENTRVCYR